MCFALHKGSCIDRLCTTIREGNVSSRKQGGSAPISDTAAAKHRRVGLSNAETENRGR
jgi:hypothetical protein